MYSHTIARILCQQVGLKENTKTDVLKMKLRQIVKEGSQISIAYKVNWLVNDKKTTSDLVLKFVDGLSEDKRVNNLFCEMVSYATAERKYY